jgi:hypothetical protein
MMARSVATRTGLASGYLATADDTRRRLLEPCSPEGGG